MSKTALITGTTAGFGKAMATKVAQLGYNLIITGRRTQRLHDLAEHLTKKHNVTVCPLNFDIRDKEAVKNAIDSIPPALQTIDLLVNNAGLAAGATRFADSDMNDFEQMIDTNIKGLLYITQLIVPRMIQQKNGHIVNISSIAGIEVYPNGHVYCATKHALNAITKGLRIDLVKQGIRVSSISPGMAETEFSIVRYHGDTTKAQQVYEGITPLTAQDIADTLEFIITRPAHVMINDIQINPSQQANTYIAHRK